MRHMIQYTAALISVTAGAAFATLLEVPYTGGKKAGTVVITKVSNGPTMLQMSPDTVKIGAAMIRLTILSDVLIAVCGAKPTLGAQFTAPFAVVQQTSDTSTYWNAYNLMPTSGLVPVDSIDIRRGGENLPAWRAPGFALFDEGAGRSCTGSEFFMAPRWNRVVFMRFGSGVDYRMKVSFQAYSSGFENPTMMIDNTWLNTITMHYVLNNTPNDLSGAPVSLRRPESRVTRNPQGIKDWRTMNLYNPLGVKLRRDPRRFEAVVSVRQ